MRKADSKSFEVVASLEGFGVAVGGEHCKRVWVWVGVYAFSVCACVLCALVLSMFGFLEGEVRRTPRASRLSPRWRASAWRPLAGSTVSACG